MHTTKELGAARQHRRGRVVRVPAGLVRRDQQGRLTLAQHVDDRAQLFRIVSDQPPIGEAEVHASGKLQHGGRRLRFLRAFGDGAVARQLAARHVADRDAVAAPRQLQQQAPASRLGVVRVCSDRNDVEP